MSREDLEELTVPTFGLEQGGFRISFGAAVAEVHIRGLTAQLLWYDAAGHPRRAEPAEVKREFKTERQDIKRQCEDITHMLAAQRDRLERLPLTGRTWSWPSGSCERYLDHPLVGHVARRLIWRFRDRERRSMLSGCDQLVDATICPVEFGENAMVSAWHPILCDVDRVALAKLLEHHEVTQPFKQAHREVYLLTDAERTTRVYSNRFAAHVLRQHQFNALAIARGWQNTLRLAVDSTYPPAMLLLPHWGLRAEFWIEGASGADRPDINEAGTYVHITTDQVRFYPIDAAENSAQAGRGAYSVTYNWQLRHFNDASAPLSLEQLPTLVFSEVMRDIDLFVGVASIGNDPLWEDGGSDQRYRVYWREYSFGELSLRQPTRASNCSNDLSPGSPSLIVAASKDTSSRCVVICVPIKSIWVQATS